MAKDIVKDVQYFYQKVLSKAFISADWNEEKLLHAFGWSAFCKKVYEQEITKNNFTAIDDKIHSVCGKCIGNLQSCSSDLYQAFLHNPNIDQSFLEQQITSTSDFNHSQILEESLEIDTLCTELTNSLKDVSIMACDRSIFYEVKAELYLDHLVAANQQNHLSDVENEAYLASSFSKLLDGVDNKNLLFHTLLVDFSDDKIVLGVQEFCCNWIILEFLKTDHNPFSGFLWKQSPLKLRIISLKFPPFYSYYIDRLIKCAGSLHFKNDNGVEEWIKPRNFDEVSLSFGEICYHFQTLLNREDHLHQRVCNELTSLKSKDGNKFSIWKSIHKSCFEPTF